MDQDNFEILVYMEITAVYNLLSSNPASIWSARD